MNAAELTDKLSLHSLRQRNWYIQATCATTGDGLYEGLDWLSNQLKRSNRWSRVSWLAVGQPASSRYDAGWCVIQLTSWHVVMSHRFSLYYLCNIACCLLKLLNFLCSYLLQFSSCPVYIISPVTYHQYQNQIHSCLCSCAVDIFVVFTALHGMQSQYSDGNSVSPSVCQTRALWQNRRRICLDFYIIWKNIYPTFLRRRMVGGGRPLLAEILGQPVRVGAKSPILNW